MNPQAAKVSLRQQLVTCAVFCVLAGVVMLFHRNAYGSVFVSGLPLTYQMLLGIAFGAIYWVASLLGSRFVAGRRATRHMAESYNRLDLSGLNPLWMALAAGVGEELLFRGALQPVLGIWLTSVAFVLVHIRAYRLDALNKRVLLQSVSIFAISVALGYLALYAGLLTAILVHAAMDAVGLFFIRRMARSATTPMPG
ncbi:MAG: CPBP family intramembrane glutamic endopeptidase [Rhodanobacter sp.]